MRTATADDSDSIEVPMAALYEQAQRTPHGTSCWCRACLAREGMTYARPELDTPAAGIPRRIIWRASIGPAAIVIETI